MSGAWATAEHIDTAVSRAEELGYDSLWTFQRLLSPVDENGADRLEPQYRRVHDPLSVLAYVAGRTTRARLGVAVLNAPFYSPVMLAKSLATVDVVSRGRLDVGLGIGWLPEEFEAAGTPFEHRGARLEEFLAVLQSALTDGVVQHLGACYRVPPAHVEPKPLQRPRPPILLGGTAAPALRRAGRLADGWVSSSRADLAAIDRSIDVVKAAADDAGRDPEALRFVCRAVVKVRSKERAPMTGSIEDIAADLRGLDARGVTEAFVDLNFDPQVASPTADPDQGFAHAMGVLEALAPGD